MKYFSYAAVAAIFFLSLVTVSVADSDHSLFSPLLEKYVDDEVVDYPGFANSLSFDRYIKELAKPLTSEQSSDKALAYWINAYNAFAIQGILDGRSPSSFLGRIGYFKKAKYQIAGRKINLYDLERKVIIPLGEPRIHFAINCASGSCPKLRAEVYNAENLEQQLEDSAKIFIRDAKRNRFDRQAKVAYLSKIFDWFEKDFKQHSGSVQKYVAQYVDDPELARELKNGDYKIKFLEYDWSLNGIAPN